MAEYCLTLLKSPELGAKMREACLTRARKEFSSQQTMANYEEIYYRVLNLEAPQLKPACS